VAIASAGGHIKAFELLLKIGVDITTADTSGLTPLIAASAAGHAEVVKLLLKTGVDINTAVPID
jgi:ankyrin repeat protein